MIFLIIAGCSERTEKPQTSKEIFQSYRDKGVGTVFAIPPSLASMFLDEEKTGNAELKDLLADIKHLYFLIIPNSSDSKENLYYSEIDGWLSEIAFQDLAMINSGSEIVKVKILDRNNGRINEMIILVSTYESLFCISFIGDIKLNKIINLTQPNNLEAISSLNRFKR